MKLFTVRNTFLLLCGILVHTTANTQTGSIIRRPPPASVDGAGTSSAAVRNVFDRFASCTLDRHRNKVKNLLSLPSMSEKQVKGLVSLARNECLNDGKIVFNSNYFRSALFVALVRDKYSYRSAILPDVPLNFLADFSSSISDPDVVNVANLLNFAGCVIHQDSENARLAVLGPAGSNREDSALSALTPILGRCLPAEITLKFNKGTLVGMLAEAYYREAVSQ